MPALQAAKDKNKNSEYQVVQLNRGSVLVRGAADLGRAPVGYGRPHVATKRILQDIRGMCVEVLAGSSADLITWHEIKTLLKRN